MTGLLSTTATQPRWVCAFEARLEGAIVGVTSAAYGRAARVEVCEGDRVDEGQLLVALDPGELDRKVDAAAAGLARAMAAALPAGASLAQTAGAPMDRRLSLVMLARRRHALAVLHRAHAEVRAPVAGRVLAIRVRPREQISLAQPVASILESDRLDVLALFAPPDFARLRAGQAAVVTAGRHVAAGTIRSLPGPGLPVRLEVETRRAAALRPGMNALVAVRIA